MKRELTFSQQVQVYINTLDWEGIYQLSPEERKEAEKAHKLIEGIVDVIILSRETLTDSRFAAIEELVRTNPDEISRFLK